MTGRKITRLDFGSLYKKHGSWHWRYYDFDATGVRKQKSERICEISDEYRSKSDVVPLVQPRIKQMSAAPVSGAMTIAHFADTEFIPWVKANKRPATADGYEKLYLKHLRPHFADMKLRDYRPHNAVRFMGTLAPTMTSNSLMHVRALMSAIFAHAVAEGRVDVNPIRDARCRVEAKASKPTQHYTPTEVIEIITALKGRPEAQAAVALGFFAGLRTAEIAGLQWGDINADWHTITIQRSVWRGIAAPCKTDASRATILLIEPLRSMLKAFKEEQRPVADDQYVLVNSLLRPLNLGLLSNRVIRPALAKRNLVWKGYYAGRRGLATELANRNQQAAMDMLRHTTLNTTRAFYVKSIPAVTLEAMNEFEAEYSVLRDSQGTASSSKSLSARKMLQGKH